MSVLDKLACSLGRRDEVPNQELARELVKNRNTNAIRELVQNLANKNVDIQNDCIKALYEIGYIQPDLVAEHVQEFLKIIQSKNNRLVWGGMLALSTVAKLRAKDIHANRDLIQKVVRNGSVITVDNGIKALALAAATDADYNRDIFPFLLEHLQTTRPKDIPQHAESILPAVTAANRRVFIETLTKRLEDLSPAQAARVKKAIRAAEAR